MANATEPDRRPTTHTVRRRARWTELARPGFVLLVLGTATLLAGGYRAMVELTEGRISPLVPVAVGAPLAAEFLILAGAILLAAAALLTAASRRRDHR